VSAIDLPQISDAGYPQLRINSKSWLRRRQRIDRRLSPSAVS